MTARSTIYDGSSRLRYLDWKEALHREVQGLTLTASQWLDLLQVRTEKAANDAIQPARVLQRETSPEQALNMAWQFLDQQFNLAHLKRRRSKFSMISFMVKQSLHQIQPPSPPFLTGVKQQSY